MLKRGAGHYRYDLSKALVGACGGARTGPSSNRADLNVVNLLLQYGADPDGPDDARGSPLFSALLYDGDGRKIIRVLLRQGASVNIPDELGITPLMVAAAQNVNMFDCCCDTAHIQTHDRKTDGRLLTLWIVTPHRILFAGFSWRLVHLNFPLPSDQREATLLADGPRWQPDIRISKGSIAIFSVM